MLKRGLIVVAILAAAAAGYWRLTADSRLRGRIATLAGNLAQRQLWREDTSPVTSAAIEKLAAPQSAAIPPAGQPAPTPLTRAPTPTAQLAPGAIPPGITSDIRIVSGLREDEPDFIGKVPVITVDPSGERITLQLSAGRDVTVVVRVAGKPPGVTKGSTVEFYLRWHPGVDERLQFVGLRTESGIEIESFLQAGPKPVTVKAQLLSGGALIAEQSGPAFNNMMRLDITGPAMKDAFNEAPAQRQYGERTVRVLASEARTTPPVDGAAFGVELLTWRLK